jgi:hypothetical protein
LESKSVFRGGLLLETKVMRNGRAGAPFSSNISRGVFFSSVDIIYRIRHLEEFDSRYLRFLFTHLTNRTNSYSTPHFENLETTHSINMSPIVKLMVGFACKFKAHFSHMLVSPRFALHADFDDKVDEKCEFSFPTWRHRQSE